MTRFFCFVCLLITSSTHAQYIPKFDVQGYRGSGLKIENTIYNFLTALDSGVTTLKMDVVITKDKRVVLSSEPTIALQNCMKDDSSFIAKKYGKSGFNIYQMKYAEIQLLTCDGVALGKPLLEDLIVAVENHIKGYTAYEVDYAIELKSSRNTEGKFHPEPEAYSDLVYQLIDQYLPLDRIVIQSADFRVLKYWHKRYPEVRLGVIISNSKSVSANLRELGFTPSVYSINYKLLKQSQIQELHNKKIRVIPWTVNELGDMKKLKDWNTDGFVTAYPQRASSLGFGLKFSAPEKKDGSGR